MSSFDRMKQRALTLAVGVVCALAAWGSHTIRVNPVEGDATRALQAAIDSAATFCGEPVEISLAPVDYHISRENSTRRIYYISNTASTEENPDPTKHIGLLFKDLKNVTLEGNGAWIVTHGEMTPLVADSCVNIAFRNFTLTAADPSVPEFKVEAVDSASMTVRVTAPSTYQIENGNFNWVGEGWIFADGRRKTTYPEFAQVFYPDRNVTLRVDSPLAGRISAEEIEPGLIRFRFAKAPAVHVGEVYQMRHGIRSEACGFFNRSKDVSLTDITFHFLGNFGLVGQYSENLAYDNIRCAPDSRLGRTDAGFADFVQMSGCRGNVRILNSYFEGAHDDPINIHGTHLKVMGNPAADRLIVRFMHGQTYGFLPFTEEDEVEVVDRHTLNCLQSATLKGVRAIDLYNYELTLDRPVAAVPEGYSVEDLAVENVTWTPDVEIRNNWFARYPTRGILITTRGRSLIEGNTFFRSPMPAVLVSDDARGWYESGPVADLTIRNNRFIECASPVICISPEIDRFNRPVHSNIVVEGNRFILTGLPAVQAVATDGLCIQGNVFDVSGLRQIDPEALIQTDNVERLKVEGNRVLKTYPLK